MTSVRMNNLKIMPADLNITSQSKLTTEILEELNARDLSDLVDAMDAAIEAGAGLGWSKAPPRDVVEKYFKGVLLVPERTLFVGRVDGTIASAAQLIAPSRYNTAQQFSANILAIFVAPWARGHGMGRQLLTTVENEALLRGYSVLNLDVRETQKSAIALFEKMNYQLWGTNPYYAEVENEMIRGLYFGKVINQAHLDTLNKK